LRVDAREPAPHDPSVTEINRKSLRSPDESLRLPGVTEDLVRLGELTVARVTQEPGWRWSVDMRSIAGGEWCASHHVGVNLSGRQGALLQDGRILEFGPDDVYDIPPGHDGYTIGDEPAVMIEWSGLETWGGRGSRFPDRTLMTLLFTDIVGSTATIARIGDAAWQDVRRRHYAATRAALARFRGREVDTTGDGFLATFDGPARALRCAAAIRASAAGDGLHLRIGVHVGEVEAVGGGVGGLAVHEAARIMASAGPDEILVSSITRELASGAGLEFADRGEHELKGVPGPRRLYAYLDAG
jgi:class 3 adenylate cyclase